MRLVKNSNLKNIVADCSSPFHIHVHLRLKTLQPMRTFYRASPFCVLALREVLETPKLMTTKRPLLSLPVLLRFALPALPKQSILTPKPLEAHLQQFGPTQEAAMKDLTMKTVAEQTRTAICTDAASSSLRGAATAAGNAT